MEAERVAERERNDSSRSRMSSEASEQQER